MNSLKEALRASERRATRATKRARDLEKAIEPIMERIYFWAKTPLEDDANAPKVLTVGQCRRIAEALVEGPAEEAPVEEA